MTMMLVKPSAVFALLSVSIMIPQLYRVAAFSVAPTTKTPPTTTPLLSALSSAYSSSSSSSSRLLATINTATTATASAQKTLKFWKYEGLGNDFILIDDRDKTEPSLTPDASARLCHRNFGIGADGVIFALQSPNSDQFDYAMRIYNSDGSEPEMCGNGIRCMAQFLQDLEAENARDSYKIHTLAGTIIPVMNRNDKTITVDMGEPILSAPDIPTTLTDNLWDDQNSIVEQPVQDLNGKTWKVNAVSMGNPHAVIFVDDLERDVNLAVDGPALEGLTSVFPKKTNVEFVQVLNDSHLRMKVWERGAGPTLACGTGTCALVVAAVRAQKIPPTTNKPCRVTLPGGDLWIEWRQSDNKVYMTGPATLAFEGCTRMP
jgi:diaminopimelate epimerase